VATQAIEALGFTKGSDGIFRDVSGQKLSLEIRTTAGDDLQGKTMFAAADYWQRIGVDAEPFVSPTQRARDLEYRANFPGFELARQPNEVDYDAITRLHGAQSPLPENNYVGRNRMRYRDPEFDRLIDQFITTIPRQERMQILGQIIHHMTEQVVPLGVFYNAQPAVVGNRVLNVVGTSPQGTWAWNAHEWDLKG
jgi:peptide/nickel transport system substrate-binding protein